MDWILRPYSPQDDDKQAVFLPERHVEWREAAKHPVMFLYRRFKVVQQGAAFDFALLLQALDEDSWAHME